MTQFSGIGGPNFSGGPNHAGRINAGAPKAGQPAQQQGIYTGPPRDVTQFSSIPSPSAPDFKGLAQSAAKFASGLSLDDAARYQHPTTHRTMCAAPQSLEL